MSSVPGTLKTRGVATSSNNATPGPTEPTSPSKPNGPPDTVKNITATRGPRRRADGRRVTGAWDRAQRPATERATSTAVAAAASLVMGGNLMITMFDVAVVGAGPARATAALTLARRGLNVALLEKDTLPRYKTCGGALVGRALALLPPGVERVLERRCGQAELHLLHAK